MAGTVGRIVGGSSQFMNRGPDHWHPNPDFFYRHGAGSLHDIGPYYISHLVAITLARWPSSTRPPA